MHDQPLVTFYPLIREPAAPHLEPPVPPQRATRDASGTLPSRALRYCDPVTKANAFGFHLFPPTTIGIKFDGVDFCWSYDVDGTGIGAHWWPLDASAPAFYPGFVDYWQAKMPSEVHGLVPPFIVPVETRGFLQIWTGLIARTAPNWSLLVRSPVNDSRRSLGFEVFEGIIETDQWGGHLFVNCQVLRTDIPIVLYAQNPFVQVQPLLQPYYSDIALDSYAVRHEVPDTVWKDYRSVVSGKRDGTRPLGHYAVSSRRREAARRAKGPRGD